MIGEHTPTPQDMPSFLAHGVTQLLQFMRQDPGDIAKLIPDFDEICICKATDKSLQTVFSAVAADYVHQLNQQGGKAAKSLNEIIHSVNSMPRATLAWKTSFEASLALLHPGEVRPLLQSINELLASLDAALTLQSRFISDAAHQLKTPMAVLETQLELALREQDPAQMRVALEKLQGGLNGQAMRAL